MTLLQLIENLNDTADEFTICAAKLPEWTPASEAELCLSERVNRDNRLHYFLEVPVAKDVLLAWSFARNGRTPTLAEKCEALIYFAENDAYLIPE